MHPMPARIPVSLLSNTPNRDPAILHRSRRFWLATLVLAALALASLSLTLACSPSPQGEPLYRCPMHPQVTAEKPGDCSICGMRLVPVAKGEQGGTQGAVKKTTYICPMHPEVTSDKTGDCPICGMHLVPRQSEGPAAAPAQGTSAQLAPVRIDPESQRRMNLATSPVEQRKLSREVRTSARIVPDETRLYHVTAKVEGYVEKLFVNVTGQLVQRGQPLLSIYSPDLVASQQEFLVALSTARTLGQSPYPTVSKGGQDLVEAARRRLKLWDISDEQIGRIERTGQVERTLVLYAPASGYVSEKSIQAGHRLMAGEPLLTLVDLSTVWAEADIYESDLPYVKVGMPAALSLSYLPGQSFRGRISFLNPFLDPQSRTLKARLEIPNPRLLLKPEMYGEVTLSFDLGERLAIPEWAVLPTGKRTVVFVKTGEGSFTPTEISLGARSEGYFEVLSGVNEGDQVVTSANFLLDSESSLKAALQAVSQKP